MFDVASFLSLDSIESHLKSQIRQVISFSPKKVKGDPLSSLINPSL